MKMKVRRFLFVLLMISLFGLTGCVASGQKSASSTDQKKERAIVEIKKMIESKKEYTTEQILPLYDHLDPVDINFMIGTWKGGKFDGGKMPDPINWYGKRFNSAEDAEPLLARKPDGTIYSFDKWGMARLREVKFRGKVTASLIYNQKPIMDYFRKLDNDTLIAVGEVKGKLLFFFHLTRQKDIS